MHASRPTRVLAYVRVSSDGQERSGTSLAGQREEIARHCTAVGWPAPRYYVEAESAGEEKLASRVQLRALLDEARAGDAVVVAKQDRWTRDTLFYLQSVRDLQKRGVRFLSLAERFDPDTAEGQFAATVMAAVAEQERARIRVRTVGRRGQLRDQGCWTEGVAPIGYRRDPATRHLVPHAKEAELVRSVFEMCAGGMPIERIARELCDRSAGREGGAPIKWNRKTVGTLLDARWYLGEIRRTDGTWAPAHPPIVTRELFDAAAAGRASRRKGGPPNRATSRTNDWLLRGLATCGACGSKIGASYGGEGYYVCNGRLRGAGCDAPYLPVPDADTEAEALTLRRLEQLRSLLGRAIEPDLAVPDQRRLTGVRKTLATTRTRRDRLVSLAIDGLISKDELRSRREELDASIARLEATVREMTQGLHVPPAARASALAHLATMRRAWRGLAVPAQREILVRLVDHVTLRGGTIEMGWKPETALLLAMQATDPSSLNAVPVASRKRRTPRGKR